MSNDPLSLVQPLALLKQQWKTILLVVFLGGAIAAVTVFLVPKYYRSAAVLVPANPTLADKSRFFNSNIQNLYSYFGSGDDLDRIQGVANTDTVFYTLVDEFSLVNYYHLSGDSLALLRRDAMLKLRTDIRFEKNEQGQLKIIAWTKDPRLSASLANRMTDIVVQTETNLWKKNYDQAVSQLDQSIASMEQDYNSSGDSLGNTARKSELQSMRMQNLLSQIRQYSATRNEFRLAAQTPPAVLYVIESGKPAVHADKPDKPAVILISCIVAFVFACAWVLVYHRNPQA